MRRPLLLGHRGARAKSEVPENSLASFDLAMRHGCDGFEFDVRRTADGQAVVCHDPVYRTRTGLLSRAARGVEIAGALRDELGDMPGLCEVIERYRGTAFLDVELKVTGLAGGVLAALQATPGEQALVVSSFLPEALEEVYRVAANLPLGLIGETRAQVEKWRVLPVTFVIPHYRLVTRAFIDTVNAAEKQVMVWTVNRAEEMRRFAEWGVAGIISDETELLVKTLGGAEKSRS